MKRLLRWTVPLCWILPICAFAQWDDSLLKPYVMNHRAGGASVADVSFLLDAPAGKTGFVHIQGGHLVSGAGKRLRLWGVHITDWSRGSVLLPPKEDAPLWAATLARFGVNCVRLHFLDLAAPRGIIDATKTYTATVKTDVGTFVVALDAKDAPQTVNNFVFLTQHRFFDCVIFHRVIPTFMDQTGDPTGTGSGGPGYTIPDELPAKASNPADQYPLGSVAMANTGQPHTGGSQWFIVAGAEGESLPNEYSLFGHVTSGMSVVEKINTQGSASGVPPDITHRMLKVTITSS